MVTIVLCSKYFFVQFTDCEDDFDDIDGRMNRKDVEASTLWYSPYS